MIISKGYKLGRGVAYYDISELDGTTVRVKMPKEEVVNLIQAGQIQNAKVQFWQGSSIVRCSNKDLPLVRIDNGLTEVGEVQKRVKGVHAEPVHIQPQPTKLPESKVVGKLVPKKNKRDTSFAGYDVKNAVEQRQLQSSVSLENVHTLGELFDYMAKDFGVREVGLYKKEFGKKLDLDRQLNSMDVFRVSDIKRSIASYLLNMAYEELEKTYLKYNQ